MTMKYLILCVSLLSAPLWASEDNQEIVPKEIPGVVGVDAEGLLDLIAAIPDLILIDARVSLNRKYGFIEGSVSLPDTDTNCDSLAQHVDSLTRAVLFYCNGVKCGRSVAAVNIAKTCGYTNLHWFRGGFDEWRSKGYPFLNQE
jgi:rhodanese-related sulfurtransferase